MGVGITVFEQRSDVKEIFQEDYFDRISSELKKKRESEKRDGRGLYRKILHQSQVAKCMERSG